MTLTLKVQHPQIAEGTELGVAGTFVVENGGQVEITAEQERDFIALRGTTVQDAFEGSEIFLVSGTPEISDIAEVLPPEQVEAIRNTDRASLGLTTEEAPQQDQPVDNTAPQTEPPADNTTTHDDGGEQ